MTDDEWEEQRNRAILAALQTGRAVFADTDGELHFVDGNKEAVPQDVGLVAQPIPQAQRLATRAERASRFAYGMSIIAAIATGVAAIWNPWQIGLAAVFCGCAVVWRKVNRMQRTALDKSRGARS